MRITGPAGQKATERDTLSTIAHSLGGALATWFEDQNDLTNLAKVNFPLCQWQYFDAEDLEQHAQLVSDLAGAILAGTKAASAVPYDITAATVKALDDEIAVFEGVLAAPQQAISQRKSLTQKLRD